MKKKKTLIILLAMIAVIALLGLIAAPLLSVRADKVTELESKLAEAQRARSEAESGLNSVQSEISDVKTQRETLDKNISSIEGELSTLEAQIAENEAQIAQSEADLAAATAEAAEYEELYKTRVRVMYERNAMSYLDIIFGAQNFSDLLKRVEMVAQIVRYDKAVLANMATALQNIADKKSALEENNTVIVLNKNIQDAKKAELAANRSTLSVAMTKLQGDEAAYKATLDEADAAEDQLRAEIRALLEAEAKREAGTSENETEQAADAPKKSEVSSGGQFAWPTPSTTKVTDGYGERFHPIQKRTKMHTGIDIGAGSGAAIVAADNGKVLRAGWNGGYGNYIVIDHGNGVQTLYGHCSTLLVQAGQSVSRGDQIAKVGSTGNSTGPHLHFEVLINGSYTNPMSYF